MVREDEVLTQIDKSALSKELATLRGDVDGLAASLKREQGETAEVTVRAEELSAAIQRLEWAISRRLDEQPVEASSM